mmetsp:Transcript_2799/g.4036  ORF Transcript_2799/g.4036 Transcript_2799/m.4036 type:complete len:838 (-) Transcript_2799:2685-5198(-)|eukprot:CAMPEP_0203776682 /NCGR_PEP_ID=MMETSP0099_2-20121227/6900_1 /ASSEMBLY_ACC=CAM_ASM_000209 /TAXON_ID=96639 /ORGANISM=" , Strain NY0313808BC1" /LENGTH=837 /DNA_ID=CAMNT_0050675753 /DNA_START=183 /DNA_END=2696 /DNA_ORIENTATION=-
MYERHWLELIERFLENPAGSRSRVLDEILHGKGVPVAVRKKLWLVATGTPNRRAKFPNVYGDYVAQAKEMRRNEDAGFKMTELQIRKDVRRTFPLFPMFRGRKQRSDGDRRSDGDSLDESEWKEHEHALYNVLCAVALSATNVDYHQGLNYVTAFLLLTLRDEEVGVHNWAVTEEETFWVLYSMLGDCHLRGIYECKSSFLQQFLDQFDLLVRRFLPRVHHHLEVGLEPGFPIVLFAIEWFTTVFSYSLRLDAVYLCWDLFLVARLDEALYVTGLAILFHLRDSILRTKTFEEMVGRFKKMVKSIPAKALRASISTVVQRIVPSALIPPGRSTLAVIERGMRDNENLLVTTEFDATRFVLGVQLGDMNSVIVEVNKYKLPSALLDEAFMRATFLGFPGVISVLLSQCNPSCRASLNRVEGITPLHICALVGQPTIARVLLNAGVDRELRSYAAVLDGLFPDPRDKRADGYTALDIAYALRAGEEMTAMTLVLEGDVCLSCGRLLERRQRSQDRGILSGVFDAFNPDWPQAVPRGELGRNSQWGGDYCRDCSLGKTNGKSIVTLLDQPSDSEGLFSWHCMHCKKVTLRGKSVQCKRCLHAFCVDCSFTRRRLLPQYPQPVPVCQNCHHFLRSCPCHFEHNSPAQGAPTDTNTPVSSSTPPRSVSMDVVCEHSAVDYISYNVPPSALSPAMVCTCLQCKKRRYTLKWPVQTSKKAKYNPNLPLFQSSEAMLRGFWNHGDRSVASMFALEPLSRGTMRLLDIQQIEDFLMSSVKYSSSITISPEVTGNEKEQYRDFKSELIEFYTAWNPSQLTKVDTILRKYKGKEAKLLSDLHNMYVPI